MAAARWSVTAKRAPRAPAKRVDMEEKGRLEGCSRVAFEVGGVVRLGVLGRVRRGRCGVVIGDGERGRRGRGIVLKRRGDG